MTFGPGSVLFESYGRGDPDATFVDLGVVPWLCNGAKQCGREITWLTHNLRSGRRNANPHWSPDGSSYVFTDRANIDTEDVQIWTAWYGPYALPQGSRRRASCGSCAGVSQRQAPKSQPPTKAIASSITTTF